MARTVARLTWKLEQPDSEDRSRDTGPVWVDHPQDETGSDWSEKLRDGKWMTRDEARDIATKNNWEFFEDDGSAVTPQVDQSQTASFDAQAVNLKLRSLGISRDELQLETPMPSYVGLTGSLVRQLRDESVVDTEAGAMAVWVAAMIMPVEDALAALDRLVPAWREP